MRAHHVIAVVAALALGLGVKQFLLPPMRAIANVGQSGSMNVLQMQIDQKNKNIPQQEMNDMTFVYPNP